MGDIIKALDDADLFLRNRANAILAPLNEYDIEILLDIANVCNEAANIIKFQTAEIERLLEENLIKSQKRANMFEIVNAFERGKAKGITEFADKMHTEIHQALESNYNARAERMAKPNIDMADEFISYCDGKIDCLRGLDDFVDETYEEMVGDNNV